MGEIHKLNAKQYADVRSGFSEWSEKAKALMATPEAQSRLEGYREQADRIADLEVKCDGLARRYDGLMEALLAEKARVAGLECENEKLKERIEKAKVTFFAIGSDADTAVNMYNILRGE